MSSSREVSVGRPVPDAERLLVLADAGLGLASVLGNASGGAVRRVVGITRPVSRLALRPPIALSRRHGPRLGAALQTRGGRVRVDLITVGIGLFDRLVPILLEQVLRRVDLTQIVLAHVDLDRVVAAVDLDAVITRVDLDAAVTGVDLDAIVAGVDLDAVVARVDLEAVIGRLDLDALAAGLDVDAVAGRLDVEAVLDRVDLTEVALSRLDLDALVSGILAHVDLVAVAQQVIEGVGLPELIRESSMAMTSDTVRGARMRGVAGDQALGRVRDRLLPHRDRQRVPAGATTVTDPLAPDAPAGPVDQ
jgi:hypothetical protein